MDINGISDGEIEVNVDTQTTGTQTQHKMDGKQGKKKPEFTQKQLDHLKSIMQRSNALHGDNYGIKVLKKRQAQSLLAGHKDCLVILPTGYGKTIIIQCLPFIGEESKIIVIVSPLDSIIHEQATRFGAHCQIIDEEFVKSLTNEDASDQVMKVQNGKILYLIGHPEKICCTDMRKFFMKESITNNVSKVSW